jgi:DNA-binding HxlR family transcriptional regulator
MFYLMAQHSIMRKGRRAGMAETPFRYGDRCPVARALAIVGERWSLLILRDLALHGARRFADFERSLAGVSPNTLSARLKTLEDHGIVATRLYEDHPPRAEYVLTEKGEELRAVLKALRQWGEKHTARPAVSTEAESSDGV